MPHNDKHYQKLLRTHKFIVKMVLEVLFVLGAGLSLMWLFDRLGGSFMSRGWQVFFIIVFAFLVAGLQIPGYIMDIRKIEMGNSVPAQPQKPKPYAAITAEIEKAEAEWAAKAKGNPSLPSKPSLPSLTLSRNQYQQDSLDANDGTNGNDGSDGSDRLLMPTFYSAVKGTLPASLSGLRMSATRMPMLICLSSAPWR